MYSIVTLDPVNNEEEVDIMEISNVSRWIYFANKIEFSTPTMIVLKSNRKELST
jgi:hypothetical protein